MIKLEPVDLQLHSKQDSGAGILLWILQNSCKHLLYKIKANQSGPQVLAIKKDSPGKITGLTRVFEGV